MAKKFYVVWQGVKPGIYTSWAQAKAQIDGQKAAQYMGFDSEAAAKKAFAAPYTLALKQRNQKATVKPAQVNQVTSSTPKSQHPIAIYCDGACSPNPGKAGTGIAIYQQQQLSDLWYGLYDEHGTNNSAELLGLLMAFRIAKTFVDRNLTVEVLSDSRYSIDCITKWAEGWQKKGWTRGKGEEIKNLALIKECFNSYKSLKHAIAISYVKGHANIEGNELADRMAVLARNSKQIELVPYKDSLDIQTILAMPSG
ncbi:ribonuclease H family protein [Pseudoalteromonas tunicata]|uniref:ribonuclease H family protein n=1 Tax=Pseudoalteromonas tunicata TaxID=314281 RepID=UPI00273F2923|nr:ribonuclease H family protein [Pseudoalteromonas tunicata]MDP4982134.1 ribonuclease H family protein [Pseudoalteromonas tunicata]